jgi:hypothetical protein
LLVSARNEDSIPFILNHCDITPQTDVGAMHNVAFNFVPERSIFGWIFLGACATIEPCNPNECEPTRILFPIPLGLFDFRGIIIHLLPRSQQFSIGIHFPALADGGRAASYDCPSHCAATLQAILTPPGGGPTRPPRFSLEATVSMAGCTPEPLIFFAPTFPQTDSGILIHQRIFRPVSIANACFE